jgi:uncharacterized protein (TIGR03086 family)
MTAGTAGTTHRTPSVDGACDAALRSVTEFGARVAEIGNRWDQPTALPGWDVRALVRHVVTEQRWAVPLLAGATPADAGATLDDDLLGHDPLAAAGASAGALVIALGALRDGRADRTVHLSAGPTPVAEYVMELAADHLVHTVDLARALGLDDTVDPGATALVRTWFAGVEDAYRDAGVIGARLGVPPGAGPQAELLGMAGRVPMSARAAVARFDAAFGRQDLDAIMAAMTPDCVFEDTSPPDGRRHEGAAAVRAAWAALFDASPDGTFAAEELVAAGDRVTVRWRYSWGDGHVRGVDLFTVRDGLVAEKVAYVKG